MTRPRQLNGGMAFAALLVAILSLARAGRFWPAETYLDPASGTWTALAVDLAHGTVYRPLFGELGYGGTRYFPLHFLLQGALIRCGVDPVAAGLWLSAVATGLLCASVAVTLKVVGARRLVAVCCGVLVLASSTAQEALLSIKADALAAAVNLLGFAAALANAPARRAVGTAALLFTLAFATKPTAVSGFLASLTWLSLTGRGPRALALLALCILSYGSVLAVVAYAGGLSVYSAGGAAWSAGALLRAPWEMARLTRQVPETLVFFQLGLAAAVALAAQRSRGPAGAAPWLLASTCLTTAPIFMFEGTDTNHLLELHAISLVAVGAWIETATAEARRFTAMVLTVAGLAAALSLASGLSNAGAEQRWGTLAQVVARLGERQGPVLAENPLVPIARGERPYLLDAFMFRVLHERNSDFAEPLWNALRERRFAAVVLDRDPHTDRGREWYRTGYFGDGFVERLEEAYQVAGRVKNRIIYVPRP